MAQSAGARQSLRGEEGFDRSDRRDLVAGPLCPAVPGAGTNPQRSIPLGTARKSPGNDPSPRSRPAQSPAEVPHLSDPKTRSQGKGESVPASWHSAIPPRAAGMLLGTCPEPAASLLPRQRRTRGFVPVSPGMKRSSLALPAARVTRPGDKGLAGTFSKSPWKAPATPRPSPRPLTPGTPECPGPSCPSSARHSPGSSEC